MGLSFIFERKWGTRYVYWRKCFFLMLLPSPLLLFLLSSPLLHSHLLSPPLLSFLLSSPLFHSPLLSSPFLSSALPSFFSLNINHICRHKNNLNLSLVSPTSTSTKGHLAAAGWTCFPVCVFLPLFTTGGHFCISDQLNEMLLHPLLLRASLIAISNYKKNNPLYSLEANSNRMTSIKNEDEFSGCHS